AERQAAGHVDLVDEDNQAAVAQRARSRWSLKRRAQRVRSGGLLRFALCALRFAVRQDDLPQSAHEALERADVGVGEPEPLHFVFDAELLAEIRQEPLV